MSKLRKCALVLALSGCISAQTLLSQDTVEASVDLGMLSAIRSEELNHSQVMDHAGWIADVFGPRVTDPITSIKRDSGRRSR